MSLTTCFLWSSICSQIKRHELKTRNKKRMKLETCKEFCERQKFWVLSQNKLSFDSETIDCLSSINHQIKVNLSVTHHINILTFIKTLIHLSVKPCLLKEVEPEEMKGIEDHQCQEMNLKQNPVVLVVVIVELVHRDLGEVDQTHQSSDEFLVITNQNL